AERAIIDGAANLKQKIRPSPRPAHLLRFVHPAVHQKIGRPFGDRGADPQFGTVPLGVVDQPVALSGEITIQCVQGGPQLSRRRNGPPLPLFPLKMMHHCADTTDADVSILWLCHSTASSAGARPPRQSPPSPPPVPGHPPTDRRPFAPGAAAAWRCGTSRAPAPR